MRLKIRKIRDIVIPSCGQYCSMGEESLCLIHAVLGIPATLAASIYSLSCIVMQRLHVYVHTVWRRTARSKKM